MPISRVNAIDRITGFSHKDFPFTYLGCPIYFGLKKISYFTYLIHKIRSKIRTWQSKMLSMSDCLILIKHALLSIPVYLLAVT